MKNPTKKESFKGFNPCSKIIVLLEILGSWHKKIPLITVCCVTQLRDASRSVRVVAIFQLSSEFSIHYFMYPLNDHFHLCKGTSFYLLKFQR